MSAQMMLQTFGSPWRKARATLDTSNSFTSKIIVGADPFTAAGVTGDANTATGASLIMMAPQPSNGAPVPNGVSIMFYGTGADDATFAARIIAWSKVITDRVAAVLDSERVWIPHDLVHVTGILSTFVGLAGKTILDTHRIADTLAISGTTANAGVNVNVVSPANNRPARLYVDLEGAEYLEIQLQDDGSATAMGALYKFY